ncbi:something about silencing protein sas10, putative [Ricinus communis]|uniref:Something about silencing protein sas10, putative n=1 Tax=Ricinus communis TaxID=3988 RepID=B9SX55_RICCO|nr:something about silencing protein sas10, putative [Ricinus communis]
MGKRGRNQKNDNRNAKRSSRREYIAPEDMDDDVDAFHKQRDIIPLDINGDDVESSEEEDEAVLDYEVVIALYYLKMQQKFMREKYGVSHDEIHDDEEVNEEDKDVWGGKKNIYYGGGDYEGGSSDSDALLEEEQAISKMQKKKTETLSMDDFGLENVADRELTMEEISVEGKRKTEDSLIKGLNALSKKEKMDAVYSSAPELVGLLSELNDALEELETRVNPLLDKVKMGGIILEGGLRYLEVKQLLLLAYCQAITFYLLLKSEGQPIRDHPVIARLVEIKGLLEKMKQLNGNFPSEVEEFLKKNNGTVAGESKVIQNAVPAYPSESARKDHNSALASAEADTKEPAKVPCSTSELVKSESLRDDEIKEKKHKHKTDQVAVQSVEMLKVRAKLEEKLKQKRLLSSFVPKLDKAQKHPKSVNRQLETYDDFNDDAIDVERGNHGLSNGQASLLGSSKLSQLVSAKANKPKAISGDDDLPKRDDIGERRRKHEIRVLAGAGVKSEDDAIHEPGTLETDEPSDMEEDGDTGGSGDEFYKEIKQKRDAKFVAKAEKYARKPTVPALPETIDGKRHITRQIEKNIGLTRQRRKDLKNPRKKYRTKHDKQKKRWKGQVQQIRKPDGSYGGETTGINAAISRSIRF